MRPSFLCNRICLHNPRMQSAGRTRTNVLDISISRLDFLKVVRTVFWSGLCARRSCDRASRSLSRYALKSSTCEQVYFAPSFTDLSLKRLTRINWVPVGRCPPFWFECLGGRQNWISSSRLGTCFGKSSVYQRVRQVLNNLKTMSLEPYNKKKSSEPLCEYSNIAKPQIDVTSTAESPERPSNNLMPSISSKESRRRRRKVLSSSSESEEKENKDINKETCKSPVKVISGHEHYRDYKTPQEGENKMASSKSSKRRKRRQTEQFVSSGSDSNDEEDDKNW